MILWTAAFCTWTSVFCIICVLVGFVSSRTDPTKYLDSCTDAGGANSFFKMDENVSPGYIMYNISNVDKNTFSVHPEEYLETALDGTFGIISLKKSFDYEKIKIYTYSLICKYKFDMDVIIRNVIEGKLNFENSTYVSFIHIDTTVGSVIIPNIRIKYGDANPSDIRLNFTQPEFFLSYKSPAVYQLQLKKKIYSAPKEPLRFNVTAYLEYFPDKTDTAEFVINVLEKNTPIVCKPCTDGNVYKYLTIAFGISNGITILLVMFWCLLAKTREEKHNIAY